MDSFLDSFKPAAELVTGHASRGSLFRVLTHNDADGVASGGVIARMAIRLDARFRVTVEKKIDGPLIDRVAAERNSLVILSDFGSGYLDLIESGLPGCDVLVLDHHIVNGEAARVTHVNPLLHGVDGARDVAAAGVCYLLAREVDPRNADSAPLALVGALGDQQDRGPQSGLTGVNALIERHAEEAGLLERRVDLSFYGYETRPLPRAIAYTTSPFIPGLSGREDNCVAFLSHIGLELRRGDRARSLADLSEEEKRTLYSALSGHMLAEGCDPEAVRSLIGTVYTFPREQPGSPLREGREFASLLNACARMRRPSVGLSLAVGDRGDALREAEGILEDYRRRIAGYLDWAGAEGRIRELPGIYFLDAGGEVDENIVGVVIGMLLSGGKLDRGKPIVACAMGEDGTVKVSARATDAVAVKGIHLGRVMQEAASALGGGGGGHDVAAGAYLPPEAVPEFIRRVDDAVRSAG